jgi:hypothetical protein
MYLSSFNLVKAHFEQNIDLKLDDLQIITKLQISLSSHIFKMTNSSTANICVYNKKERTNKKNQNL